MKLVYNKRYLVASIALLVIETWIALTLNDRLIRPYLGDTLAVVLIYTLVRSFHDGSRRRITCAALGLACAVEVAQSLQLVSRLGLENHRWARTVLGTSFDWADFVAYLVGAFAILAGECMLDRARGTAESRTAEL